MTINISSTLENFKIDAVKVYDKYVNKGREFEFNNLEASITLRVSGLASVIFGAVAVAGALSAIIAFAPFSAVVLGCTGAFMLTIGHDAIKIGDNISKQLNPSISNTASSACNHIRSAISNTPAEFQGTIIKYYDLKFVKNIFN
jgi:hypothetical protein